MVKGTINLGFDIKELKVDVDSQNKIIRIDIPEIKVLANEIKDTKVYNIENSVFVEFDLETIENSRKNFKEKENKNILKDEEELNEANNHAKMVIQNLLSIRDGELMKDYTINFE